MCSSTMSSSTDIDVLPEFEPVTTSQRMSEVERANQAPLVEGGPNNTPSLEALQTNDQRLVLDTVSQVRKSGLESILALPQLAVCGDQSAGKSSVLEALTEIPFPRNDELCTRFATEIIMRRAALESLTIKVIPDEARPMDEKTTIQAFTETITDFADLPIIIDKAKEVMGLGGNGPQTRAFARDILSITIEGPFRPQLTLVDLPGLIQNETKGVTRADVELVKEITDRYISQSRTICLAVVSATNDYANQGILTKVREVDPDGERTLGIITKPDRLPSGSGSEAAYINLARNKDIFFKLGWHVVKNRSFEEGGASFEERNASEVAYFRKSSFKCLPKTSVGIESLRERLSKLLFEHIKQELPKLFSDLNHSLNDSKTQLSSLGNRRSSSEDCKRYLMQLSLDFHKVCGAAVNGQYEGLFFKCDPNSKFTSDSRSAIRRLRAMVQKMNREFTAKLHKEGHTYFFERSEDIGSGALTRDIKIPDVDPMEPVILTHQQYLCWALRFIIRNRGRELPGNFNPLVIGELFWEQSAKWGDIAMDHIEDVLEVCRRFLDDLLHDMCPTDVASRLSTSHMAEAMDLRHQAALRELEKITIDLREHPINYNHYYTDTVDKCGADRDDQTLAACIENATTHALLPGCTSKHTSANVNMKQASEQFNRSRNSNMDIQSCEKAIDCLLAIYKVSNEADWELVKLTGVDQVCRKVFEANITTQVVERHLVRNLGEIFSPVIVDQWEDSDVNDVASEPSTIMRERAFLEDRILKLESGHSILRRVMRRTART